MTIEERLREALITDTVSVCAPNVYVGNETIYYTFNYDTVPEENCDDAPLSERALVQVHLYCPLAYNPTSLRYTTKRNLVAAGFTWPEEVNATNQLAGSAKEGQHYVYECEILIPITEGDNAEL